MYLRIAGFDVAEKNDWNSFTIKRGPLVEHVEQWPGEEIGESCDRAHRIASEWGVTRIYYDATGFGANVGPELRKRQNRVYDFRPVYFGGGVEGGDREFTTSRTNKDEFAFKN